MTCSRLLLVESLPGIAVRPHLSKDRAGGARPAEERSNALPFFITKESRPPTLASNEITSASRHRLTTRVSPGYTGETNLASWLAIRAGSKSAYAASTARQQIPKLHRPWRIGRSNPAR